MINIAEQDETLLDQSNNESSPLTLVANSPSDDDMGSELEVIQRKRAEAERELKQLDQRKVELEQWLRDLSVTERTLARVLDVDLPNGRSAGSVEPTRGRKPPDIPSVFDMATTVLKERAEEFVDGQEIVAAIRLRWWPDATSGDITPSLWRLATKDKRLRKEGTKYALALRN